MRECMQQVAILLKSKAPCIWIDTYEEAAVIRDLRDIILENVKLRGMKIKVWSHTEGLSEYPLTEMERQQPPDASMVQIAKLLGKVGESQKNTESPAENTSIWVLRDLHLLNDHHAVKRQIRDLKEYSQGNRNYNPIVVIAPFTSIPMEHEKLFTLIHYDTPSKKDVEEAVAKTVKMIEKNASKSGFTVPSKEEQEKLVRASLGLTAMELQQVFSRSLVEFKTLSVEAVSQQKIQMVEKSGVLDYSIPQTTFDDIGGNQAFKDWFFDEVSCAFTDEAREFGVPAPKGYLSLGVPGTSKTMMAGAIANHFGVPLLSLNMSKIMGSLVGQSEKKIEQAFHIVKAVSPCVFLIDEIEKALGGIRSSNSSDAGTTARVFGTVLQFLNEDHGVFVIATSNDVSQLPSELTRAGRFDTKWYFGIPSADERKDIFRIHFNKLGRPLDEELLSFAASTAKNYTGAEIREVARATMRRAYSRYCKDKVKEIQREDIQTAIDGVIPLYKSSQSAIMNLETYAEGRARFANAVSSADKINQYDESLDVDLLDDLKTLL